jgi:hypothetical protein
LWIKFLSRPRCDSIALGCIEMQERAQRIVQQKYEDMKAGFEEGAAEVRATLDEMAQCFELLRADGAGGGSGAHAAALAAPEQAPAAAAGDDVEWEDAQPAADPGAQLTSSDD